MFEPNSHSTLITGGNGYMGRLIVSALIKSGRSNIVLLVRGHHHPRHIIARLKEDLCEMGSRQLMDQIDSLTIMPFPPPADDSGLIKTLNGKRVGEIIHAAGSLDYFDSQKLYEGNVSLTERLLHIGKQLEVRRFILISTAFSASYTGNPVQESIEANPEHAGSDHSSSKRRAETLVHTSQLPYLIIRPGLVIGHSQTGRYAGKPNGLYQLWTAAENFMTDRYREELHVVAPAVPLQVIHQDAFQESFIAAHEELTDNSVAHLVSNPKGLPTIRDVFSLWIKSSHRPHKLFYYNQLADAPEDAIDRRMKIWLEFTSVDPAFAPHGWQFETGAVNLLRSRGLKFNDATIDTITVCQQQFLSKSDKLRKFFSKHQNELAHDIEIVEPISVN